MGYPAASRARRSLRRWPSSLAPSSPSRTRCSRNSVAVMWRAPCCSARASAEVSASGVRRFLSERRFIDSCSQGLHGEIQRRRVGGQKNGPPEGDPSPRGALGSSRYAVCEVQRMDSSALQCVLSESALRLGSRAILRGAGPPRTSPPPCVADSDSAPQRTPPRVGMNATLESNLDQSVVGRHRSL